MAVISGKPTTYCGTNVPNDCCKSVTAQDVEFTITYLKKNVPAWDLPYAILLRFDVIDPVRIDKWEGYVQTMGGVNSWINPWTLYSAKPKK